MMTQPQVELLWFWVEFLESIQDRRRIWIFISADGAVVEF